MIVSFKFYVMNFVDFVFNCYTHITSHVTQVFANCIHYTSYSLLNIVHVIVCVSQSDQPSLQLFWVFVQNIFCVWEFKWRMLKILILGKLGFKLVFWKNTSSHTHAFYSLYSMLWEVFFFSKIRLFFLKCYFSRFSIDPICFSINRNCI